MGWSDLYNRTMLIFVSAEWRLYQDKARGSKRSKFHFSLQEMRWVSIRHYQRTCLFLQMVPLALCLHGKYRKSRNQTSKDKTVEQTKTALFSGIINMNFFFKNWVAYFWPFLTRCSPVLLYISFLALFFSVVVFAYGTYREVLTWYDKIKFNNFLFFCLSQSI